MRFPLFAAVCILLRTTVAVFADEAWNVDYHYALLGEPQEETTFFHQPNPTSKASLIYTLSKRGVVGAVNPRDGSVVWRQLLSPNLTSSTDRGFLRAGEGQDTIVSGYGSQVAAWSAADGRLAWTVDTHGPLKDVEILELSDGKIESGAKDVVALSGGGSPAVQRLDGASGAVKWQHKFQEGDEVYQLSASTTEVFAILLHKTVLGYIKIRVVSLDPVNGRKTDEYTLSSEKELASAETIISVGANSASPIVAWTDAAHSVLKINIIGTKTVSSYNIEKQDGQPVEKIRIHAPYHANSLSHFLVNYQTATSHWADIYHIDHTRSITQLAYSLPNIAGQGSFSTSTSDANVYFTRITQDELITVSSASHGVLGRWTIDNLGLVSAPHEAIVPTHTVSELSVKGDSVSAIRTAVLLSTGDWVLLRDSKPVWARPEALADIRSATFATPSVLEDFQHKLDVETHRNFVGAYLHRVKRHLEELKHLPSYMSSMPQRFISGFLGTTDEGAMASDSFGFHKVIVCATGNGRLMALDAGSASRVLWSRRAVDLDSSESWQPGLSSRADVIVLERGSGKSRQTFNATNGDPLPGIPDTHDLQSGLGVQYTLRDGVLEATRTDKANAGSVWHFTPMADERILHLVPRPVNDPVASIGKVLGDRRVLYKYLDSNLALLATANDASTSAQFYVLDTITGSILHSSAHSGVDLQAPISSILSENWFAYSYTAEASDASTKGHHLVVGEMFESLVPNDRGGLNAATNFSTVQSGTDPFTLVQTYQIPEAISKMAVTQTRQGITSRQLLAVLADVEAIVGIPYNALDPRRPVNRAPTKDEQMEGLVQYEPVIEFDPKWFLNHQREVLGIENVMTNPALIESTSIVFAYGLDIFGTRLSPSFSFDILGKDFNKFQMLATVAALAVATFVVAPLVMRKQVNTRWQFT
ncbi:hypothetical protein LTR37_007331 [Vermiconidia calcicola]|uniref:Uncharacterized protein n=1 Tax=Vermiconidia calcicola TaxID=1690605 RepID=A0ACC3NDN6_9PEZI|nr:hypothetical protein LTR37_007331 [Vermiconidia calcicola]